jgi:hypothetical protein
MGASFRISLRLALAITLGALATSYSTDIPASSDVHPDQRIIDYPWVAALAVAKGSKFTPEDINNGFFDARRIGVAENDASEGLIAANDP